MSRRQQSLILNIKIERQGHKVINMCSIWKRNISWVCMRNMKPLPIN